MGAVRAKPCLRTSSFMQRLHSDPCWREDRREGNRQHHKDYDFCDWEINYSVLKRTEKNRELSLFVPIIRRLTLLWDTKQYKALSSRLISFSHTVWGGARFFWSHIFPSGVSSTPARCTSNGEAGTSEEDKGSALNVYVTNEFQVIFGLWNFTVISRDTRNWGVF